jgi:hypothetical protein
MLGMVHLRSTVASMVLASLTSEFRAPMIVGTLHDCIVLVAPDCSFKQSRSNIATCPDSDIRLCDTRPELLDSDRLFDFTE